MPEAEDELATESVYKAASDVEALAARSLLEDQGVASVLVSLRSGAYPGVAEPAHWGELRVAKKDAARARELLAELTQASAVATGEKAKSKPASSPTARRTFRVAEVLLAVSLLFNVVLIFKMRALSSTTDRNGALVGAWDSNGHWLSYDRDGHVLSSAIDSDGDRRFDIHRAFSNGSLIWEWIDRDGNDIPDETAAYRDGARIAIFNDLNQDQTSDHGVRLEAERDNDPERSFPQLFDDDADGFPNRIACRIDEKIATFDVDRCRLSSTSSFDEFHAQAQEWLRLSRIPPEPGMIILSE